MMPTFYVDRRAKLQMNVWFVSHVSLLKMQIKLMDREIISFLLCHNVILKWMPIQLRKYCLPIEISQINHLSFGFRMTVPEWNM